MNLDSDSFARFSELVHARRSMRAFRPDPVPRQEIEEIFALAGLAPSNCNTQPWHVYVAAGARAASLKTALVASIGSGNIQLDFPYNDHFYKDEYKVRQRGAAKLYFAAAGIERGDQKKRVQSLVRNLEFFDAPHAAFIFMPDWAQIREACDVGMFAQNVMLAMRAKNIGSCPQTLLGYNASVVREQLGVADNLKLLFGISFGYFDPDDAQNTVRTARAELASVLTICE